MSPSKEFLKDNCHEDSPLEKVFQDKNQSKRKKKLSRLSDYS